MDINIIFEKLFNYFQTSTIRELSEKINMSESTVSKWRQRKSINAIKKKCRELGIYEEIFDTTLRASKDQMESFLYPTEYFNDETDKLNPYNKIAKELENLSQRADKTFLESAFKKISKMDKTIISSFLNVYEKLEKEENLIKLYDALGKLKFES
jgi:transcriptional regulator with XRE-family HTH domain